MSIQIFSAALQTFTDVFRCSQVRSSQMLCRRFWMFSDVLKMFSDVLHMFTDVFRMFLGCFMILRILRWVWQVNLNDGSLPMDRLTNGYRQVPEYHRHSIVINGHFSTIHSTVMVTEHFTMVVGNRPSNALRVFKEKTFYGL